MAIRRHVPVPPSAENLRKMERTLAWVHRPLRWGLMPLQRITVSGLESFPRKGPVLVLGNHAGFLDPVTMILATRRPIQFMASEGLLQESALAPLLCYFGVVAKKKQVKDSKAVRHLKAWVELGAAVGLFPEGQRTWDGRPLPLAPGIEKLVRLLDVPVVTARLVNAYHQWPRWAVHPRAGRVHLSLDPPRRFAAGTPLTEVRAEIERAIRVDDREAEGWRLWGRKLALGVANPLFACPACGAIDALREAGDTVSCSACPGGWRVDLRARLWPLDRGAPLELADAFARAQAHLAETWTADPRRFEADGTILRSEPMRLLDTTAELAAPLAEGHLVLRPDALAVESASGAASWTLPLSSLDVADVDMRRRLVFRAGGRTFEAVLPTESVIKWGLAVPHWMARAGVAPAPADEAPARAAVAPA
jgi:1-acyl-sn-glycerol-3-phosphate acyltransferase